VMSHAVIQFARVATLPARLLILTGRIWRQIRWRRYVPDKFR
jgi:hypothetical protein